MDFPVCIPLESAPDPQDPAPTPEALAIEHQQREHLEQRLRALLPSKAFRIVRCIYFKDLSPADTARVMGIPSRTMRRNHAKALQILRGHPELIALLTPTATS